MSRQPFECCKHPQVVCLDVIFPPLSPDNVKQATGMPTGTGKQCNATIAHLAVQY
eukprot:m.128822 g.128822  ORF g.128822 m.128822 type:complete len:55 (+) comp29358_c8_seq1:1249-1413(+)